MHEPVSISSQFDSILVLDFGSQYSHLITRRVREFNVYCEMIACNVPMSEYPFRPKGIILSGGPYSVYEKDAPHLDKKIFDLDVPILGICYGLQELAWTLGGKVDACQKREYGPATVKIESNSCPLFANLGGNTTDVWMSHGDQLSILPPDFHVTATTTTSPFAGIAHSSKPIYGIQFHPEVTHSKEGPIILSNFVRKICACANSWSMSSFIDKEIARIRDIVGAEGQVVGAVSGGVDSTVASVLMKKAIGDRFHAILVDNGVMRMNECAETKKILKDQLEINLTVVDESDLFLDRLAGVTDPEKKRKIIGNTFIEIFEREAKSLSANGKVDFLLQGTLYPDVIESVSFKGPSATIKTHHNVGGLLPNMKLKLIEPLRELFKDEVRALGELMGIHKDLIWRHPFPGPGISIRILGQVTRERVRIVQEADNIFISEIKANNLYREISQAYAALLPIKSVGVMGDQRTYEEVIALRAVTTTDFMTADWYSFPTPVLRKISNRIINEVNGVNRVVYDVSSKPPATIEWE